MTGNSTRATKTDNAMTRRPRGRPLINRRIIIQAWIVERETNHSLRKATFAKAVHISPRSFSRILRWGIETGLLPPWTLAPQPIKNIAQCALERQTRSEEEYQSQRSTSQTRLTGLTQFDSRENLISSDRQRPASGGLSLRPFETLAFGRAGDE